MNTSSKNTFHQRLRILQVRKGLTLLLLVCFLNTIFFPAVWYPSYQYITIADNEHTSSLAEFMIEDYLGLDAPNYDYQEEDVDDILETTEDIDFIVYYNTITTALVSRTRDIPCSKLDSFTVQSFYSCSTPPPEYFL